MKLAEALNERADLQKKIASIRERLAHNVLVQEGDMPAESPDELFKQLDSLIKRFALLVSTINKFNLDVGLTELLATRDAAILHHSVLSAVLQTLNHRNERYGRNEIKFVKTISVAETQDRVDELAKQIRELNNEIQRINWEKDIVI